MADIFEYIVSLTPDAISRLYSNVWACQAVFRALSPLARQYVLRTIFVETPFPASDLLDALRVDIPSLSSSSAASSSSSSAIQSDLSPDDAIATSPELAEHRRAVWQLTDLRIIEIVSAHLSASLSSASASAASLSRKPLISIFDNIQLSPIFQSNLRMAVTTCPASPFPEKMSSVPDAVTPTSLESYATKRWESVLNFIADQQQPDFEPSPGLIALLQALDLVRLGSEAGEGGRRMITNAGFQFLLRDLQTQMWTLLRQYVNGAPVRGMPAENVLSFLLSLGFLAPAKSYDVAALDMEQRVILQDLCEFGLVYKEKPTSSRFYVTKHAHSACQPRLVGSSFGSAGGAGAAGNAPTLSAVSSLLSGAEGFIIVETNNMVYAYTNSNLQVALLSLFVQVLYRLPNMVIGMITRESVRAGLMNGITAKEILNFLYQHAHPHMRRKPGVLPETVADQIVLWEQERNRVEAMPARVLHEFPDQDKFEMVVQYASDIGALLWTSEKNMMLAVKDEDALYERMKRFIRDHVK